MPPPLFGVFVFKKQKNRLPSDKERGFRANAATPPPRQGPTHLDFSGSGDNGVYQFSQCTHGIYGVF